MGEEYHIVMQDFIFFPIDKSFKYSFHSVSQSLGIANFKNCVCAYPAVFKIRVLAQVESVIILKKKGLFLYIFAFLDWLKFTWRHNPHSAAIDLPLIFWGRKGYPFRLLETLLGKHTRHNIKPSTGVKIPSLFGKHKSFSIHSNFFVSAPIMTSGSPST